MEEGQGAEAAAGENCKHSAGGYAEKHTGCTPRDERARSVTMYCLRLNVDLFEAEMERDLCEFYDCARKYGEMLQKMAVAARYLDQDPVSSPLRVGLTRN